MKVLFFTAEWCGSCKSVKQWIGNFPHVEVVDADTFIDLANECRVRSLPTFVKLDSDGAMVDIRTGAMSEREFSKWVAVQA